MIGARIAYEAGRLIRPAAAVVAVLFLFLVVQNFRAVQSTVQNAKDPTIERAEFCASQTTKPISCLEPAADIVDTRVADAKAFLTPTGRLRFALHQTGSTPGVLAFGVLAALLGASEWTARTIVFRRQASRGVLAGVLLPVGTLVGGAVVLTLGAWGLLLISGGPSVEIAADTTGLAPGVAGALAVVATASAFGSLLGLLIRNPVGAVGAFIVVFVASTFEAVSGSVVNPVRAVAAAMAFQNSSRFVNDRLWPIAVEVDVSRLEGIALLGAFGACVLAISAYLWRRLPVLT